VNVAPDTNVLVRVLMQDDPQQYRAAERALRSASAVVLALPCLCELVWVLRSVYALKQADIILAIRSLVDSAAVVVNRPAAEAGLAMLEAGGDFADGAIAYEAVWLGAEKFVSFDRQAVALLSKQGVPAVQL
jgi:predicted nucleic-acid-binding protein